MPRSFSRVSLPPCERLRFSYGFVAETSALFAYTILAENYLWLKYGIHPLRFGFSGMKEISYSTSQISPCGSLSL